MLLGHLRDQDLATPEALAFLADLLAAGEPPSDAPAIQVHTRLIGPQTAEHWLQKKGVDGHAAPARTHALGVLAAGAARAVGATAPGSEARALLVDILIRASRSEDPVFEPEEEERFEQTLAWGEPSERVHAAEGLLAAARGTSEPHVLVAMDRLADDPVGAVRHMIATRLLWLARSAPDVCQRTAERRLSAEGSPAVMVPLIDGSAAWLGQRDAELAFRHVASILKRFSHLGESDSRRDVRRACLLLLAEWYWQSGHESADSFAEAILADPLADPLAARWFAASLGRHLRDGGEAPAAIARAWRFIEQLSATAVASHGEWRVRREQDTDGAAADALGRAKAAVQMGEEVAHGLRVASGATEEQVAGTPMLSDFRKRQLLERATPVIEGLTTLPSAQCALDLICVLESVVPAAPEVVIPLLSRAVSRGTGIGLEHEVLVSDHVVRIVEACLAQHRAIFRVDDACRGALLTLLDTLADAGWPAARRLLYRLDEIYR